MLFKQIIACGYKPCAIKNLAVVAHEPRYELRNKKIYRYRTSRKGTYFCIPQDTIIEEKADGHYITGHFHKPVLIAFNPPLKFSDVKKRMLNMLVDNNHDTCSGDF